MFRDFGSAITFNSLEELNAKLASIDYRVTSKTRIERERYYICHYLINLGNHNFFSFPMEVRNIDLGQGISTPDFLINCNGNEYYLEVVMATTTEAIEQINELNEDKSHEFDIMIDDEQVKVKFYEIDEEKGMGTRPFYGDKPQEFPAIIVSETIINKTKKLVNYNFNRNKKIELLLYYNFPGISMINWNKVLCNVDRYLKEKNYDEMTKFDRIHILIDRMMIYKILDVTGVGLFNPNYLI